MRRGAHILVEHLRARGCERIFTVPGESFIDVLDVLRDTPEISVVTCRHEGSAAMMAEATARLAGPARAAAGVAIVSRGPGLANAMPGLHVAMQASVALVVIVGLPQRDVLGRDAFQEIPLAALTGTFAKHVETADSATRIGEAMRRAITIAHAGRPGPVVIGVTEDALAGAVDGDAAAVAPVAPLPQPSPSYADMERLAELFDRAEWPVLLAGGYGWTHEACRQLQAFAERLDLPVVAAFRSQDVIDNRSPSYCGHAGLAPATKVAAALKSADLILALVPRIDEVTAGSYQNIAIGSAGRSIVHVGPCGDAVARHHDLALGIVSGFARFTERLADFMPSMHRGMAQRWSPFRRDLRAAHEAYGRLTPSSARLRLEDVVAHLSVRLPEDAIVTNGAGNYAAALHHGYVYKQPGTQLAPMSGSMGYGLPAAIAAKLAHRQRKVVCLAGDGCLQMTVQELATAAQYAIPVIVIVADNGSLGTIRVAQERRFPGRVMATSLVNPDFAALAESYGAYGVKVRDIEGFEEALARALNADRPFVIALSLERISPQGTGKT